MNIYDYLKIATAIIASLGGSALILAAFSHWLGQIWAKRMLQNERAKHDEDLQILKSNHQEALENFKTEIDKLKQKELSRHFDKVAIYKDVIHIISELLRELEAVTRSQKTVISKEVEQSFSLNRHKAYGYISLVSNQKAMDRYNDMMEFFIPLIYEGKIATWEEMRSKADSMLNEMRRDIGIKEGDVIYRGER